ncbi:MAG TPA: fumarylacetoacetate hydrolase family protein [Longimicrobiales bacterium]|nr:fumarylacetoacetate hydrolase family protein [Longimicrobiales bacterium]
MRHDTRHYIRYESAGHVHFGRLEGDTVHRLATGFLDGGQPDGTTVQLDDVRLLAPVTPGKIVAVGLNYASHLGTRDAPTEPGLFAMYPSAIVGPEDDIVPPPGASPVHFEGELVLVIGRRASRVTVEDAAGHVFGVTAGNDISERSWQRNDLQWVRAKSSDTFAPIGPAVVTGLAFDDLLLRTRLNGEVVQEERTADLLFGVPEILEYITRHVTLEPGDLVFTGTPGTTRGMHPGDVVEVEIEGVGVLRNRVRAAD